MTSNRTGRSRSRGTALLGGGLLGAVLLAGPGVSLDGARVLCPAWVGQAEAAPRRDEFQEHILEARKLYEIKDYEGAIRELNIAYTIKQVPGLLLNLGHAYLDAGRPREALDYYDRYLSEDKNASPATRADVEKYRVQAQEQISKLAAAQAPAQTEPQKPEVTPPKPVPDPALSPPPPAPESPPASSGPPRGALALLGSGAGALLVGIGLGAGALSASKEVIAKDGAFDAALDSRGRAMNAAAIAFDIVGSVAIAGGAAWTLGHYVRRGKTEGPKSDPKVAVRPTGAGLLVLGKF